VLTTRVELRWWRVTLATPELTRSWAMSCADTPEPITTTLLPSNPSAFLYSLECITLPPSFSKSSFPSTSGTNGTPFHPPAYTTCLQFSSLTSPVGRAILTVHCFSLGDHVTEEREEEVQTFRSRCWAYASSQSPSLSPGV